MLNLRAEILKNANGEPIEAVVFGNTWGVIANEKTEAIEYGKLYEWKDVEDLTDYEFDDGYGAPMCHPFYAWTPNRIIYVHEYDGATAVMFVPRHPAAIMPEFL